MPTQNNVTTTGATYAPVTPLAATVSSSMSQDVITTAEIPVDSTSPTPVGVFVNPAAGGITGNAQTEALAIISISQGGGSSNQLCHVGRDYSSDSGWQSLPLFGGRAATEVAAGAAYASSSSAAVYGFFTDSDGIYSIGLQGDGTWSDPATLSSTAPSNLRVAYTPLGLLVLYANTPGGDLFTAYQETVGGAFTSVVCSMGGVLSGGGFQLSMTDESHWTLAMNGNGAPVLYLGELGATEYSAQQTAAGFQGTLKSVVLSYWSSSQNTLMFLFVDSDNALHVWATNSATSTTVSQQITNATVSSATGFVDQNGNLHVYSVDTNMGLWVLHQDPNTPWNEDGTPNWSPYIAIDSGIAALASDMNPADSPTLFALDASDYSLRLHSQDPSTMLWLAGNVLQSSAAAYEVVRFRTEVALVDANGVAVPNYPVSINVAPNYSACEIWAAGAITPISSQTAAALATDSTGRLTFAILTTAGMVTPELLLNAAGLPNPVTVQPSLPVHTYLSGQGSLNPTNPGGAIPTFDSGGAALTAAKTPQGTMVAPGASNSQLAAVAAQAIQSTAMAGMNTTPAGVTGYQLTISGTGGPSFQILQSQSEFEAARMSMAGAQAENLGSIWSDIAHWFGDLWQGIKNGVMKVVSALVDVVNKVVNFVVQVGDEIAQGIQVALQGLEQAAHFIAGVFQAVAADIEDVIDWLKALFDFSAIWRTKMAFEQILDQGPTYISNVLGLAQKATDGWFSKQENTVNQAFDALKAKYAGQQFSGLPNWQSQGKPPSQTPVAGGAAPSDFTTNVHHNWALDKVNAYAPASAGGTTSSNLQTAFQAFVTNVGNGADDFITALKAFKDGIAAIIQHPTSFETVAIPDFLTMVQNLVDSLLSFCDAIVDLLVSLADVAMVAFQDVLTTNLDIPVLSTLWAWMADAAGYPDDAEFTVSALLALVAAFPTTVIYKLIAGVDEEPFPNGTFPGGATAGSLGLVGAPPIGSMPPACVLASAILQIIYVIPAAIGDGLGADCPKWLSIGTIVFAVLIWFLGNGIPDLSTLEWIGTGVVAANLLWILPTVYFVVQTSFTEFFDQVSDNFNDILVVLISLYGFGKFVLGAVLDFVTTPDTYQAVAKLLLPQGPQYAFLQLSALRDDPLAPLFIALNVVMDGVGYIGGGVLLTIDAANNLGGTAVTEGATA